MTIEALIAMLEEQQRTQLAARETHETAIRTVRGEYGPGQPTVAQSDQLRAARDAIAAIDADVEVFATRITELRAEAERDARAAALRAELIPVGAGAAVRQVGGQIADLLSGVPAQRGTSPAVVTREERTYSREKDTRGECSFFRDAYSLQTPAGMFSEAASRLQRHAVEVERDGRLTQRAVATGGFAGLIVPQYLINLAARVIRAGRPAANVVTSMPLPDQGMTLIIPRGTTGASVSSQATENTALSSTDEIWANVTVPVVTIGGQQDVSRQSLERGAPGTDELVFLDLAGAYLAELDRQVLYGSGASNQMLGMAQTASINTGVAFGAAVTYQTFFSRVAGLIQAIAGAGAGIAPQVILMHPRRWGWLTSLMDSTGRPILPPSSQGPFNSIGLNSNPGSYGGDNGPLDTQSFEIVGYFQGLPVVTDANMPSTVGTAAEDLVLVFDPNQSILWENGDGMPQQLRFEQTLGNQLTVKLIAYGYAGFSSGRYPQSVGRIGGIETTAAWGLAAPTF